MVANGPSGLPVDFLLPGYRLFGVTDQVSEKLRLGDVLNNLADVVGLNQASVFGLKGELIATLPEIVVEKRHIVAAIPQESEEYQLKHRQFRAGMPRPPLSRLHIFALLPPFAATGLVHLAPNSDLTDPVRSGLARFFPLTNAELFRSEAHLYSGPIVLLNRDLVAMLGRTGPEAVEDRGRRSAQAGDHDVLGEVIAAMNEQVRR